MAKHSHVLFVLFMHPLYILVTVAVLPRDGPIQALQSGLTGQYGFDFAALYWTYVAMVLALLYEDARLVAAKLSGAAEGAAVE